MTYVEKKHSLRIRDEVLLTLSETMNVAFLRLVHSVQWNLKTKNLYRFAYEYADIPYMFEDTEDF